MHHSISHVGTCFLVALSINTITISNASVIPPNFPDLAINRSPSHGSPTLLGANPYEAPTNPLNHREWAEQVDHQLEKPLWKRGSCLSRPEGFECSAQVPTVAECVSQIEAWGQVGNSISVFYTGLDGASGLTKCKQYFACHPEIGSTVLWDNIVDTKWFDAQAQAIVKGNSGSNPSVFTLTDSFQKRMTQAFAQASKGDAYLCTPAGNSADNNFNQNLAWGGWEYPALTRNKDVSRVIRVDPVTGNTSQIWAAGQPATKNEPRG